MMDKILVVDNHAFHVNNISFIDDVVKNGAKLFFRVGLRDGRDLTFGGYTLQKVAYRYQREIIEKWDKALTPMNKQRNITTSENNIAKKDDSRLSNPIEELDLPEGLNTTLINHEIFTIGQLAKLPEKELLSMKNIGDKQLLRIKNAIESK